MRDILYTEWMKLKRSRLVPFVVGLYIFHKMDVQDNA
jgi:hypothetical protein